MDRLCGIFGRLRRSVFSSESGGPASVSFGAALKGTARWAVVIALLAMSAIILPISGTAQAQTQSFGPVEAGYSDGILEVIAVVDIPVPAGSTGTKKMQLEVVGNIGPALGSTAAVPIYFENNVALQIGSFDVNVVGLQCQVPSIIEVTIPDALYTQAAVDGVVSLGLWATPPTSTDNSGCSGADNYPPEWAPRTSTDPYVIAFQGTMTDDDGTPPSGYTFQYEEDYNTSNWEPYTYSGWEVSGYEVPTRYSFTSSSSGGGSTSYGGRTVHLHGLNSLNLSGLPDGLITTTLTLTDSDGNVGAPVTDTIIRDRTDPVVYASGDAPKPAGATDAQLLSTGSFDETSGIASYLWQQVTDSTGSTVISSTAPEAVTLSDASAANPTFTVPTLDDGTTLYFKLTVTDNAGHSASAVTEYQVNTDNAAPTFSIERDDSNPSNASSVTFSIDFSKAVQNVDASDFTITTTDTASSDSTVTIRGGGFSYTATVSNISGTGTLGLTLSGSQDITDLLSIALDSTPTLNEVYDVGYSTFFSVARDDASPTNADSVDFSVDFSDDVQNVDAADFVLATTGTATADTLVTVSGSGSEYTVTLTGVSGAGTLGLSLSSSHDISGVTEGEALFATCPDSS
jgi:hypothetical protein